MNMRIDTLNPPTLCLGVGLCTAMTTNSWKIPLNQAQRLACLLGQDELVQALCHIHKLFGPPPCPLAGGVGAPTCSYPEVDTLTSKFSVGWAGGDFLCHNSWSYNMCGTLIAAIAFSFTLAFVTFAATAVITDMRPASYPAVIGFVSNSSTSDASATFCLSFLGLLGFLTRLWAALGLLHLSVSL